MIDALRMTLFLFALIVRVRQVLDSASAILAKRNTPKK
jgi:hypothetical protein